MKVTLTTALGLSLILILAGCATSGEPPACPFRNLIGHNAYGQEVETLRQSGKDIRLLYPDSFLGFSKNPNRLNVIRDENGEILAVNCG